MKESEEAESERSGLVISAWILKLEQRLNKIQASAFCFCEGYPKKEIEISQQTYYRWRQKYGGMSPDMIKQLRAVQKENAQLKRLVADQALDISILKVAAEGNF